MQKGLKHMSKFFFTKAAAVGCSLALLSALNITATAQTQIPNDTDIDTMTDLTDGCINIIAGSITAEPGETVKYPVYIANNAEGGFTTVGLRVYYDENLTPCMNKRGALAVDNGCTAGNDVMKSFCINPEEHLIGLGTVGAQPEFDNGVMFTVDITVPEDAAAGAVYPITLEVDKWLDSKTAPLDYVTLDGCITVAGDPEPEDPQEDPEGHGHHGQHLGPLEELLGMFEGEGELHIYWGPDGSWRISGEGKRP